MVKINFDSTGERKIGELTIAPVNFELLETQRQDLYKLLDSEENGLSAQETTSLEGILNFLNMICDSYIDEIDWICTDPSCNQYRKDVTETIFMFKEDRIINPVTKETEVFEMEINIDDYTWEEIIDSCNAFGYTATQVDKWLTEGEEFALIAECLFELET